MAIKTSRNSKGKASQYQDESTAQTSNSNVIMRMHLFLLNVRCHQLWYIHFITLQHNLLLQSGAGQSWIKSAKV